MKKLLLLLPLLVLGLASCKNNDIPNEDKDPDVVDPEKPTPDTGKDPEPETPKFIWDEQTDTLMKEHLNGFVLPKFTVDNYSWTYDEDYECLSLVQPGNNEKVDAVASEFSKFEGFDLNFGPEVVDSLYCASFTHVLPTSPLTGYVMSDIYSDGTTFEVDLALIPISESWDTNVVNASLATIGLTNYALPAPSFDIEWMETNESYAIYDSVSIYLTVTQDFSEQYIQQLKDAGFVNYTTEDYGPDVVFLADANNRAYLDVYYDSGFGQIFIDIYKI